MPTRTTGPLRIRLNRRDRRESRAAGRRKLGRAQLGPSGLQAETGRITGPERKEPCHLPTQLSSIRPGDAFEVTRIVLGAGQGRRFSGVLLLCSVESGQSPDFQAIPLGLPLRSGEWG